VGALPAHRPRAHLNTRFPRAARALPTAQVLEALAEIAFAPQFLPTRVEKERKAVLAEAQVGGGGIAGSGLVSSVAESS